ncbi:hypothetical protein SLEP1_g12482 [Rubroshorea leprosula]|uniref:Reverse transcriptase domain-containing protein n=1 Tax=Rubroshorea leprosula TaxID=152421 RepID=A0AAV5IKN1_9ROSI|nr:hypothetical protein SLEP1_g12482 [Rubroshorea leprosula]
MERGGSIPSLVQTDSHAQDNQSKTFPQLTSNGGSRSESSDRSPQNTRLRIHQRRSRLRRETGPYSTSENFLLGVIGSSPTNQGDGNNGEDPCYCKVLNVARDGGRYELQLEPGFAPSVLGSSQTQLVGSHLGAWVRDQLASSHPGVGFLAAANYNNLGQCETLDDIKMHLSATEYGPYVQNGTTEMWLLWNEDEVIVDVIMSTIQGIHAIVKDIQDALFSLKPFKAPGPDGLHPIFFQKMWPVVVEILCTHIKNAFTSSSIPNGWNDCLISLILKIKNPETVQQFRPIGLCNTTYKIISKILVNRIKLVLETLISPCQTSFVPKRKGTDNILILQDLFTPFPKKKGGKFGDVIIKLDLEKAYDRLEWSFIREALVYFQFPSRVVDLIMSCISTSHIVILVNGDKSEKFIPSRGIRQGDPFSPYLFTLCMEFLSIKISRDMAMGLWKGFKASKQGPTLSHLFFADDLIFVEMLTLRLDRAFVISWVFKKRINWENIWKFLSLPKEPPRILANIFLIKVDQHWQDGSLDPSQWNFIWGTNEFHHKIHLVGWDTICQPKDFGGLGIKKARDTDLIAVAKLNWRLHTDKRHLWKDVISKKYYVDNPRISLPTSGSPVIKSIAKGYSIFKDGIRWTAFTGHSILFWSDCWVGKTPLNAILYGLFSQFATNLLLSDILVMIPLIWMLLNTPFPKRLQALLLLFLSLAMSAILIISVGGENLTGASLLTL